MSHLIKSAILTSQLVERRDGVRLLLGEKYSGRVGPVREMLRGMHKATGMPLIECALEGAKSMDAAGRDPSLIFAAVVDELEAGR